MACSGVKKAWKVISEILHRCWVTLLTFVLIVALPTIILALTPFYLYRFCLCKFFKPILRRDLGSIMTTRSSLCSADDIYGSPNTMLVVYYEVDGQLDIDELRQLILNKLVLASNSKSGSLMYPELQQTLVRWGGYNFWKDDLEFDIKNHCNYYGSGGGSVVYHAEMLRIKRELLKKPLARGRALWETHVIPNYMPKGHKEGQGLKSAFITRFHHSLADGFAIISSVLRLNEETLDCVYSVPQKPTEITSSWTKLSQFLSNIAKILRTPYDLAEQLAPLLRPQLPPKLLSKSISLSIPDPIPFDYIRSISKINSVSVSTIITGGFTAAVRSYFLRSNQKIPEYCPCIFPLPAPGHSFKMRNLMSFFFMRLPIGQPDPWLRIQDIESQFIKIKNSALPLVFFKCIPIFGALPTFILQRSPLSFYNMTTLSSFPGPKVKLILLGKNVTNISFGSGLCPTNLGMLLTGISYNGHFNLMGMGDTAIIPTDEDMTALLQESLDKEFTILSQGEP